jgi:hypothetical protein
MFSAPAADFSGLWSIGIDIARPANQFRLLPMAYNDWKLVAKLQTAAALFLVAFGAPMTA